MPSPNRIAKLVKHSAKLNAMAELIPISRANALKSGIDLLKAGNVVAVPTDTLYGLACDATNMEVIHKMYSIKHRNESKPVAICFGQIADIKTWTYTDHLPSKLLSSLLPGPVTLILNSVSKVDKYLCHQGKIGVRIPNYNFIRNLAVGLGRPLALTSANLSNEPSAVSCTEFKAIWDKLPAVFDGGTTHCSREGSTVIDLSEKGLYHIVRPGVAFKESIGVLERFNLKSKYG